MDTLLKLYKVMSVSTTLCGSETIMSVTLSIKKKTRYTYPACRHEHLHPLKGYRTTLRDGKRNNKDIGKEESIFLIELSSRRELRIRRQHHLNSGQLVTLPKTHDRKC